MVNNNIPMTEIEALVYGYLVERKISFRFQSSLMGGIYKLGGAVIDFLLPRRRLGFRVMGEFWHRGIAKEGADIIQKENLTAMGLTVIDLWEEDLHNRLEETMTKALLGVEMI